MVLERGVGREERDSFDHGFELMRLARVLAVLLAFRVLGFAFWGSGVLEQKYLKVQKEV